MMPRRIAATLILLLAFLACRPSALFADLPTHLTALTDNAPDRTAASPAAQNNADYIAAQLARSTRQRVLRQSFLLTLPIVDSCTASGRSPGPINVNVPLAPLLPSGFQPAALAPEESTAELLYLHQGSLEDLRGHDLAHRFIALDITSDPLAWQTAAALGARGIIFLGNDQTAVHDLLNKTTTIPLGIPRFYCDDSTSVARIKSGEISALTIDVRIRWQEKRLENLYCLLPGKLNDKKYIILQARYDASSLVQTRAPGATQAASTAALLDLAEKIAAAPSHTSVLLLFTAGDEWNLRGTRAALDMLNPAFADNIRGLADLKQQTADADARLRKATLILNSIQHTANPAPAPAASGLPLDPAVRTALEDQLLRESSHIEESLQHARLAVPQDPALLDSLQSQKDQVLAATSALSPSSHAPITNPLIQSAARNLLPRWQTEVSRLTLLHNSLDTWPTVRSGIGDRNPMLFICLALSSGSPRYGFFSRSFYSPLTDATGKMASFPFRRYVLPSATPASAGFVAESLEPRFTLESFFPTHIAFSSDAALARSLPAGALATVQDPADFLDTPNDLPARLNMKNLLAQEDSLFTFLLGRPASIFNRTPATQGVLTDPTFYARADLPMYSAVQDVTLFERAIGESLPRLTAANCLLGGQAELGGLPLGPLLAGTRRLDWYLTYADGSAQFSSAFRADNVSTRLQACDFDSAGLPLRTLAGNQAEVRGLASFFYPNPDHPVRSMLFDSRRLDCYGLFDPRYLDTLDKIDILDARRLDKAQFSNVYVAPNSTAAVFLPPDIPWQLLLAKGALSNRMLLINADAQHPAGAGFTTTDLAFLGPLPWRNVLDLDALNTRRQQDLEKFGISSEVVRDLQSASKNYIEAARAAEKSRDYPAFFAAASSAWSLQSQVYQTLIDTSNGIIKGVIFLLLGIIPFSYFLERLLIGSVNVYRQIVGFAAIFAAMTLALWFHPAFRISSAPLMILLAFLILILSTAVVYILWGKFEEEIARLRGAGTPGGAAHSTSLRRGAVLGAAVRLGLSNMRRRGTRTALTLLTLVLLTFTLLCFTSVRESVQITPRVVSFPADLPNPPPGILLRQRGWQTLPRTTIELARQYAYPGTIPIAQRWWYASEKAEETWALPVRAANNPQLFYAQALLGLDPAEAAFQSTPIDSILPGFSTLSDNPNLCWLPAEAQKEPTLYSVGNTVDILGHRLTIAGFFTDNSFRKLRQLTGDPLSPSDPAGNRNSPAIASNDPAQLAAFPEASSRFLNSSNLVVVPAPLVRSLGGRLTSIMFRPGNNLPNDQMLAAAEDLARKSAFVIYASDGARVRSINASLEAEPKDFSDVLVPLIIAGVIILNTMLGAVAERTREIHVYTSIGLAPSHVGMLFLAEAAALGTIGVVSGYIFGQGLATVLSATYLLPGVDLNYSSLSAIVTMGLVLGLVMLSALWPARAASRVAAPSLERSWKLPRPVGDILSVELPFTVNETAARGVCAFLEEFFVTTTQAGTGRFTADNIQAFTLHSTDASTPGLIRGLDARIWLAPYDLGVIQMLRLTIHPTPQHNIFEVRLELTREAGNPGSWRRLNRPFLVEIRKQFLLWRNLPHDQITNYLARSDSLFTKPDSPTSN